MSNKLYVGNLSWQSNEETLKGYFSSFGNVLSARIITDRESGRSKGFGFIEMSSDAEAAAAIAGTNGKDFDGRPLRVNEAQDKPRNDRERGGGGYKSW